VAAAAAADKVVLRCGINVYVYLASRARSMPRSLRQPRRRDLSQSA